MCTFVDVLVSLGNKTTIVWYALQYRRRVSNRRTVRRELVRDKATTTAKTPVYTELNVKSANKLSAFGSACALSKARDYVEWSTS